MALAYGIVLLLVYAFAAADYLRIGLFRGLHPGRRRALLQTYSMRWINYWVMAQVAAIALFWMTGDKRGIRTGTFFLTAAIMMLMLVPAGQHFALRMRLPSFPLFSRGRESRRKALREFSLLLGAAIIITTVLVKLVKWTAHPAIEENFKTAQYSPLANALFAGYVLIGAAVTEELIFRHYLLARLMSLLQAHGRSIAIIFSVLVTSSLFAMGHAQMIIPAWLKFTQMLLLGITLGITRIRLGSDYAILMHALYNGAMAILASGE